MKAKSLDKKFDAGRDFLDDLAMAKARRPNREQRRLHAYFPTWMVESLDRETSRLGVTRQSIIKFLLAGRLERPALYKKSKRTVSPLVLLALTVTE